MGRTFLLTAVCLSVFVSCGPKKLDMTSSASTDESVKALVKALSPEGQKQFEAAVADIIKTAFQKHMTDFAGGNSDGALKTATVDIAAALHGRTADEVVAQGAKAKQELLEAQEKEKQAQRDREKQQALLELNELTEKWETMKANRELLTKLEVKKSRLKKSEGMFSLSDKTIEISVANKTGKAVSKIAFQALLKSPGREVPWLDERFNYEIKGGLQPDEEATWHLEPGFGGAWREVELKPDMVFTVTPIVIFDSQGTEINANDNLEELATRMDALRNAVGNQ